MTPTRADLERLTTDEHVELVRLMAELFVLPDSITPREREIVALVAGHFKARIAALLTSEGPAQRPETPTPGTPQADPFGDHPHGHRAVHELAKIVEVVRFTPGQASGYHLSSFAACELILKWASKWAKGWPETPTVGTCATCKHLRNTSTEHGVLAYGICGREPEEFPLHWQEVTGWEGFGCTFHETKPLPDAPKEPTPA